MSLLVVGTGPASLRAQQPPDPVATVPPEQVEALIDPWKDDPRGPYAGLRWFCPDGSVRPPQGQCDKPGGLQHAQLKPEANPLREQGLYLGQILAGTDTTAFWNAADRHTRLKQYQLETYLYAVDDGWILRRAQYYRGAFQAEDEAEWGRTFLRQILREEERLRSHFYLLRQAAQGLPPEPIDGNASGPPRSALLALSPPSCPFASKSTANRDRRTSTGCVPSGVPAPIRSTTPWSRPSESWSTIWRRCTAPVGPTGSTASRPRFRTGTRSRGQRVLSWRPGRPSRPPSSFGAAVRLLRIRRDLPSLPDTARLTALDLSTALESILLRRAGDWPPSTRRALLEKGTALARAAAGAGHLAVWEWKRVSSRLSLPNDPQVPRSVFDTRADALQRVAGWGTAMTRAHYQHVVNRYAAFEPKARGFIDDRVRSSVLLPLGRVASRPGRAQAQVAGRDHQLMDLDTGRIRGLTSGITAGTPQSSPLSHRMRRGSP